MTSDRELMSMTILGNNTVSRSPSPRLDLGNGMPSSPPPPQNLLPLQAPDSDSDLFESEPEREPEEDMQREDGTLTMPVEVVESDASSGIDACF